MWIDSTLLIVTEKEISTLETIRDFSLTSVLPVTAIGDDF
jgi:hypothetical protein